MQDAIDQLLDKLVGIWQRRWWVVAVAWVVSIAGWLVVHQLPDRYEAQGRIFVDTDTVLKPLLRGLALQQDGAQDQVQLMFKYILNRNNLEKIARLSDLDLTVGNEREFDTLIAELEESIKTIKLDKKQNLYLLSYQSRSPQAAKRVLDATVSVFQENFLGESRTESRSAQEFLDREIAEYSRRLLEEDRKLADFKRENAGLLPGEAGSYYERLQAERRQLETASLDLREREGQLQAATAKLAGSQGRATVPSAVIATRFDERIASLQARLDDLSLRFTEQHPDIIELQQLIKELERQRQQELDSAGKRLSSAAPAAADSAYYNELQLLVAQMEAEVASLRIRVATFQQRVTELEAVISKVPEVEANLLALRRGYEITQKKYEELLNRREQASTAQRVDEQQDGLKFRIIDQPRVLPDPVGPPRLMLLTAVLMVGLGGGLGVPFLLGEMNPRIFRGRTLVHLTNIPLLGEVTDSQPVAQSWAARFGLLLFVGLLGGLLMLYLLQAGLLLYGGDVMLDKVRGMAQGGL